MTMKPSTKRLVALFAASALILGASGAALSAGSQATPGNPAANTGSTGVTGGPWTMGGPGMMGPGMMGPGMMGASVANTEQWLAEVQQKLGITAPEEDAWKAYKQAVINQSALMNAHRETMWNGQTLDKEQFAQMRQQGWQTMQQTAQAANALYQTLTPEQQSKANGLLVYPRGRGWTR